MKINIRTGVSFSVALLCIISTITFVVPSRTIGQEINLSDVAPIANYTMPSWIWSISWSPDGARILVGMGNDEAVVVRADTGRIQYHLPHNDQVYSLQWSPLGDKLLTSSRDGFVFIWNATHGNLISSFDGDLDQNASSVRSVCWSPDARYIATGGNYDNTVHIWDVQNGYMVQNLTGHTSAIESLSWSPDGTYLASGSGIWDNSIKIWDTVSWKLVKTYNNTIGNVISLNWASNGYLLSTEHNLTLNKYCIHIWDTLNDTIKQEINDVGNNHTYCIFSARFSSDNKLVLAGTGGDYYIDPRINLVNIWSVDSGEIIFSSNIHTDSVLSTEWSPDGRRFATGSWDNQLMIWGDNVAPNVLNLSAAGNISSEANSANLSVDTQLNISFQVSESVEYDVVIDSDGIAGYNTSTDILFSGVEDNNITTIQWNLSDRNGLPVALGNYSMCIFLTDTSGNTNDINQTLRTIRIYYGDSDGDGIADNLDEFPDNPNETVDSDGDGYGDNSDAFDTDETQWNDTDGDGYGDNLDGNNPDAFPNDSSEWKDSDNDGIGDNTDIAINIHNNLIYVGIGIITTAIIILIYLSRKFKKC